MWRGVIWPSSSTVGLAVAQSWGPDTRACRGPSSASLPVSGQRCSAEEGSRIQKVGDDTAKLLEGVCAAGASQSHCSPRLVADLFFQR